ncbi:MAG: hypothetical protein QM696_08655 [Steroidobacteraceae bacterium]
MAIYEITAPDGRKYRVTGNGTQEEALAHFQEQWQAQQAPVTKLPPANTEPAADPSAGGGTLSFGPWDTGVRTPQWLDRNLSGAGKFFVDSSRGVRQLGAQALDAFDPSKDLSGLITGQDNSRAGRIQAEIDEAKRLDAPLMRTTAGKVGNIIGGMAVGAPAMFIPGAQGLVGASLTGAGLGFVQPTASGESRTANTLFGGAGGALGYGVSRGIGALARRTLPGSSGSAGASAPGSAGLNAAQRRALEGGRNLGMRVTPGQATGSRVLQQLEANLESQPMTSGPFNAIKSGNQTNMNRVFAKALGESSDVVDDATVSRFLARADKVYENVADDVARQVDPHAFLNRLSQIEADTDGLVPGGIAQQPLVKRLIDFAGKGEVTGKQAHQLRSQLGKAAQQQMSNSQGNRELGSALFDVQDIADDWLAQGLSGKRLEALNAVRGQYRNFRLMTKAGAINPSSGNVSAPKLANTLQRADERGFLAGQNQSDLYNAARFAQAFRPIVGDSGTATRSGWQNGWDMMTSLPFNLAARAYASNRVANGAMRAWDGGRYGASMFGSLMRPVAPIAPYAAPGAGGVLGVYAVQE